MPWCCPGRRQLGAAQFPIAWVPLLAERGVAVARCAIELPGFDVAGIRLQCETRQTF